MQITVGISEMKVSDKADDVLVTYSLGSCVGLALHDPARGVGGLIHCMLPLSRIDPAKAKANPMMFTDTGVPQLIQTVLDMGAVRKRLVAKVAGAAAPLQDNGVFKIGERNYVVLRKILWKNDILIASEEVGGTAARTMYLEIGTGKTRIRSGGVEKEL
ncbi:MAG: chemotaxis protein CheD [Candidatus Hydrogenedentes bacterium]|nr:chemotaxis protein CheD [Candidatus Hydrogenedentota bacterium]